jgi:putative transcriptional regulator
MADAAQTINLTNHFLIAMPGMQDATFARSVVYVCEHNERGALGLIINKPGDINLANLFQKVDLPLRRQELGVQPVFHGGPLQTERGFVLHEPMVVAGLEPDQSVYAATLMVPGGLEMTTSRDVLEALSSGGGPRRVLVTLGYSSWGEGQLEAEIARNSWLTVDASADLVFDAPVADRYDLALRLLGLEAWTLSPDAGHA